MLYLGFSIWGFFGGGGGGLGYYDNYKVALCSMSEFRVNSGSYARPAAPTNY